MSTPEDERAHWASRWFQRAEEHLNLAEGRTVPKVSPRIRCGYSFSAAELALKGALCFLQIDFGATEDLDTLRNLLPPGWAVKETHPNLAGLTAWSERSPYPGPWPEATEEDASIALETARGALATVLRDFEREMELQGMMRLSEQALAKEWGNEEDAEYDKL